MTFLQSTSFLKRTDIHWQNVVHDFYMDGLLNSDSIMQSGLMTNAFMKILGIHGNKNSLQSSNNGTFKTNERHVPPGFKTHINTNVHCTTDLIR